MKQTQNAGKGNPDPYLARWEIVILLLSLGFSIISLIVSIRISNRAEIQTSAPNIQIQSVDGSRSLFSLDDSDEQEIKIQCTAILKNVGNAPVQIVNIRWEPINTGEPIENVEQWLAVSDNSYFDLFSTSDLGYYYQSRNNPVLSLRDTIIGPGETKSFQILFNGRSRLQEGIATPLIRVIFVLSNGDELVIVPDIKYSGITW